MAHVTAMDTRGTFLGCMGRVWVCSMVMVSKCAVTRVDTIASHKCPFLGGFHDTLLVKPPVDLRLGPKDGSMQYEVHKSVRVKSSEFMRSRGLTYS